MVGSSYQDRKLLRHSNIKPGQDYYGKIVWKKRCREIKKILEIQKNNLNKHKKSPSKLEGYFYIFSHRLMFLLRSISRLKLQSKEILFSLISPKGQ